MADVDADVEWRERSELDRLLARLERVLANPNLGGCVCGHSIDDQHNSLGCYARISYEPLVTCPCTLTDDRDPVERVVQQIRAALDHACGDEWCDECGVKPRPDHTPYEIQCVAETLPEDSLLRRDLLSYAGRKARRRLLDAVLDPTPDADAEDEPEPEPKKPCEGFQWIQSFACCDRCGLPFWEHTHEDRLVGGPFDGRWEQVPIDPERAAAVKAKWGADAQDEGVRRG